MYATAMLMTMAADLPIASATRELDAWFAKLPASERAELTWAGPLFQVALEPLLKNHLDPAAVDAAAREFKQVSLSCPRLLERVLRDEFPFATVYQAWLALMPKVAAFLDAPVAAAHAEKALRAFIAVTKSFAEEIRLRVRAQDPALDVHLDDAMLKPLIEGARTGPIDDMTRASTLVTALLSATAEKRSTPERARELAGLALRYVVRGVAALRSHERLLVAFDPGEPADLHEARLLDAAATLSLAGREDMLWTLVGDLAVEPLSAPAKSPASPRLRRIVGHIAGALLRPNAFIILEELPQWLPATPQLVERALSLRAAPVRALVLSGPSERLVRIDPASDDEVPDSATRTRGMLRDWDELLHRLAR